MQSSVPMMTPIVLACLGGLISFGSTSLGALFAHLTTKVGTERRPARFSLSIDFAPGLMVAASAFTLIGPAARDAGSFGRSVMEVVVAALVGPARSESLLGSHSRIFPKGL